MDVDYSYSEFPLHLATGFILDEGEKEREIFDEYFGGVTLFPIEAFEKIDGYLRGKDPRVRQVSASLSADWQAVMIVRADGYTATDFRPLVRMNISVTVEENKRMERGSFGCGGRAGYLDYTGEWQNGADEALRQALVNLESIPAPAGEFPVVCGAGWPAVLLHEAVGHGLEGDFNRKKTSVFSGFMGQMVAAKGVTVVDDGTLQGRRGSLNIDDEGTPSQRNVLIEDGKLVGLMQDRLNARLMGVKPTGNGRRESYAHKPLPRMTNTMMLNGNYSEEEIIASVKNGIYAPHFGGGQVDITNGKFVFSASEAYKIEDGKVTRPIKGATLIGQGIEVMKKISMIGNNTKLDLGVGTCGKDGQGVPVGVGQPSLLISSMTVGGTEV
jgi:TldD protein